MSNKRIPPSPPPPAQPRVINESKIPKRATSKQTPIYKSKPITKGVERPILPNNMKEQEQQFLKGLFLIVYIMILIILIVEICQ